MSSAAFPSLPTSPMSGVCNQKPCIATNDSGMIVEEGATSLVKRTKQQDVKVVRKRHEPRQYVSKHFSQAKSSKKLTERKRPKVKDTTQDENSVVKLLPSVHAGAVPPSAKGQSECLPQSQPRIFYGLNVDELSSDSELSDVPSDIGPDPFLAHPPFDPELAAFKVKKKQRNPFKSPYFPSTAHRHRQHFLTTLPFPPLDHLKFGLMQERLAHDPFRLLIATIFLNKTPGERAMPIFFDLMKKYPTPSALSQARVEDVTSIIRTLGFQHQRARKCVAMATVWVNSPPSKNRRYRKLNYPCKGDGRDVKDNEVIDEDDNRVAWEISHLPGLGPYSHDSWRMFCRDELRGLATDWLGAGTKDGFEPEWKRVLPMDKELRAWMTWMWLKEGWIWNKETGEQTKADDELLRLARDGGVVQESKENEHLVVKGLEQESVLDKVAVEKPAGDFMI